MSNKESLQKLTKYSERVEAILALDTITYEDVKVLPQAEKDELIAVLGEMSKSTGEEYDAYRAKIDGLLTEADRNDQWESNHDKITAAISNLIKDNGHMPAKWQIAKETGLSRQTVHKHMKEYANDPRYLERKEQFRFMTDQVLARVFYYAVNGDMKAAKLYLTAMGALDNPRIVNTQNNYIQINNTILSQDVVERLSPVQVASIEAIVLESKFNLES